MYYYPLILMSIVCLQLKRISVAQAASFQPIQDQTTGPGLPDGIFSKPKIPIWVNFGVT
jgi:hypothetical protein